MPIGMMIGLVLVFQPVSAGAQPSAVPTWQLESTASGEIMPPNAGDQQTACLRGDLDGDGRDDIIIAERTASDAVVVFFRRGSGWERAVIEAASLPIEAGGALADIDGDGDLDVSFAADSQDHRVWWWENPGSLPYPDEGWTRRLIKDDGADKHHDQAFGDFDGDGELELAFWNQEAGGILWLAEIPDDPRNSGPWPRTVIFDGPSDCEGLVGYDINGDGTEDLAGAGYWFEHVDATNFIAHEIAPGRTFTRTAVGQLVPGGWPEVVISSGDSDGPLVWYRWDGDSWIPEELDAVVEHGHSLDLGDVDGDGLLDIFVAEMHTPGAGDDARSRVFFNQGDGVFTPEQISIGVGNHESRLGDVNGDGRLDVIGKPYTEGAPGLNVWLQDPSAAGGAFAADAVCLLDEGTGALVRGTSTQDLDLDGDQDVVAWLAGGGVQAFLAPGWAPVALGGIDLGAAAWADLDRDGDPDLVATTAGDPASLVLLTNPGDGTGGWPQQALATFAASASGLHVVDLDDTGRPDIVVFTDPAVLHYSSTDGQVWTEEQIGAAPGAETVGWCADVDRDGDLDVGRGGLWWRNQDGAWQAESLPGDHGAGASAWAVDLDRDGWMELLVIDPAECGVLRTYVADRLGGLTAAGELPGLELGEVRAIEVLDVDRDGDRDVLVAGLDCAGGARTVLLRSDGGPVGGWSIEPVATSSALAVLDYDADGAGDLVLGAASGSCRLGLAENLDWGGLPLGNWTRHVIDDARPWRALFVLEGDLDRDGDLDVVSGGWWYENPGGLAGEWTRRTIGAPCNNVVLVHDLDRDGDLDLLGTEGQGSAAAPVFSWAENDGQGGFTVHADIATGNGDFLQGVAIGRFDDQAAGDVILPGIALSWHGQDQGIELLQVPAAPGVAPWPISLVSSFSLNEELQVGDIDRDGDLDLSLGTAWLRNDGGVWNPFTIGDAGQPADRHRLRDLDGDGRLDLIVGVEAVGQPGPVTRYLQPADPTGSWPAAAIATVTGPMSLDAADLDLDGDLDVVVGEHENQDPASARLLILENLGGGQWNQRVVHQGDEHHDGARLADLDGDGDLDILSIGWFHDRVVVYENEAVGSGWVPGDTTAPQLVLARALDVGARTIVARFSEPVDPVTAAEPGSYELAPAVAVAAASLRPDGRTLVLQTAAPMAAGLAYELRATGVLDLADPPNGGGVQTSVAFACTPWDRVTDGLVALWDFEDESTSAVRDVAPFGSPLDLLIADSQKVQWSDGVLMLLEPVSVASAGPATKLIAAGQASGAFTVEAWIRPDGTDQTGPARIFSVSQDRFQRNVTLAQGLASSAGDRYSTRLRTSVTDGNGLPTIPTDDQTTEPAVQHVVLTREASGLLRIWVDGELHAEEVRDGSLDAWDPGHGVAVGGEYAADPEVAWLGGLHALAFYDRALSPLEIALNLAAGADVDLGQTAVAEDVPSPLVGLVAPNPFNARLVIELALSRSEPLEVAVYDLRGRRVRVLAAGATRTAGPHRLTWDGTDDQGRPLASGAYLVRARTADRQEVRKVVLAK